MARCTCNTCNPPHCTTATADKHERMKAIIKYYGGEEHALDAFPGGSEKGTRRR